MNDLYLRPDEQIYLKEYLRTLEMNDIFYFTKY